jgi:glutamate/aspartate transport system substrate-binding protein
MVRCSRWSRTERRTRSPTDDVLLSRLIATHHAADHLIVVGDFLSYEPYAIMFRRDDPAFAEVVGQAFQTMAEDRDLGVDD